MTENTKVHSGLNLDRILIEEIGQFGRFQIGTIIIIGIGIIFAAVASAEYIFTAGKLPTRCLIPECDVSNPEFEPAWLGNAVPGSPGNYDECNRFSVSRNTSTSLDTCPAELFNREEIIPCDEYVYERTNTLVYDFNLECDEWRRTLIGSIRTIGLFFSAVITGYVSDRFGRRIPLYLNTFNTAWIGLLRAFASSYESYAILQALEATFSGTFTSGYIIVSELMGPKYRTVGGPMLSSFVAIGFVISALFAWAIYEWRIRILAIFIPQLISLGYYWIIPESPRWLMSKGRFTEALSILKRAAKVNKRELSESTIQAFQDSSLTENQLLPKEQTDKKSSLLVQVLKSRVILIRCCITAVWWISTILVYSGLSVNAVSLAGNQYLNFIYVSAIEIPGFFTAIVLLAKAGRKLTLFGGFLVCSLCQFGFAFLPDDHETALLLLYLLGKLSISMVVTSVYMYTTELYPTQCRHSLLSFAFLMGRIGGFFAPLTPALTMYWPGIPSVLFGSVTLLSAALIFTTPETHGIKLPDTIEEAENLGRKIN